MTLPYDEDNPCRIRGIRLTRDQCRKRQLGNWRYSRGRNGRSQPALNPMFTTCRWNEPGRPFCPWWIPDVEYFENSTLERQYPWIATLGQLEEALFDV
jgi:hypothetical protein